MIARLFSPRDRSRHGTWLSGVAVVASVALAVAAVGADVSQGADGTASAADVSSPPFTLLPAGSSGGGPSAVAMGSGGRVWFAGRVGGELRLATGRGLGPFSVERVSPVPIGSGISSLRLVVQGSTARLAWVATSGQLTGMRIESTTCSVARCATPQTLQALSVQGGGGEEVAIATSGRGTIAMWDNYQSSVGNPRLSWALSEGGRFGKPRTVGAHGSDPALVAAPGGRIFAAWASNGTGSLSVREWAGGSRWSAAPSPQASSGGQQPQLVIAANELTVAWGTDVDNFNLSAGYLPSGPLYAATRPLGAHNFETTQGIASSARDATLDGAPDGRLVLAFGQVVSLPADQGQAEEAAVTTRAPGAGFVTPTTLETTPPGIDAGPAAAITTTGTATVEWYSDTFAGNEIEASTIAPGAAPSGPSVLGDGESPVAAASYGTSTILTWVGNTAYEAQVDSAP